MMKKETRQFLQAMWIMVGKDVVKWMCIIGALCGVAVGVNAYDKKQNKNSVKNSAVSCNQPKVALYNPFNSKIR